MPAASAVPEALCKSQVLPVVIGALVLAWELGEYRFGHVSDLD